MSEPMERHQRGLTAEEINKSTAHRAAAPLAFPAVCLSGCLHCIMKGASLFGSQKGPLGKSFTRVGLFAPTCKGHGSHGEGRGARAKVGIGGGGRRRAAVGPRLAWLCRQSVRRPHRHCCANGNSFVVLTFIRNIKKCGEGRDCQNSPGAEDHCLEKLFELLRSSDRRVAFQNSIPRCKLYSN